MVLRGEFSWVFFVPFLAFSVLLLWMVGKNIFALTQFTRTVGTVGASEFIQAKEMGKSGVYQQEVVFLVDQKPYLTGLTVRSNPPRHASGDQVPVYYDPADPTRARVGTFFDLWLGPLALSFFWLIFFILWFGALAGAPPASSQTS